MKSTQETQVNMRVSHAEKTAWVALARARGVSLTQLVRDALERERRR